MYNQFGHFKLILLLITLSSLLSGESFSKFKRVQSDSFNNYQNRKDKLFNTYLKSNWEAYNSEKTPPLYKKKKTQTLPLASYRDIKKVGPYINIYVRKKVTLKDIQQTKREKEQSKKDINFDFFGTLISLDIPLSIKKANFYPENQLGIKNFFDALVRSDYQFILDCINKTSKDLTLNDWGKYILIQKISQKIYSNDNDARLMKWFIFNKLGYSVRAGVTKSRVVLMFKIDEVLYSSPKYTIDDQKFYIVSSNSNDLTQKVFTYKNDYPDANRSLDLKLDRLPTFKDDTRVKNLTFTQYGKKYKLDYRYNQNLIDFMATYPQVDYHIFFNTPLESQTYRDIALGIKSYIDTKRTSVGLNFVLNFIQSAFKYETDMKQFSKEKIMFAQETLYYDKSDSEDRAILFALLVKKLFKIGVVGLKYDEHMSAGLYIPMRGDSVKLYSKKYIIADPTYSKAVVGQSIPRYKHIKPNDFIRVGDNL